MEKDQKKAYLFGISSVAIWSTVATAFKLSLKYTSVINLLFFASIVSTLVLFFTIIIEKKIEMLKQLDLKDLLYSFVLGMLNPFLYYIILFYAYDLLRAQEAQAINYTWAITLSIMAYFFLGQKLTFGDIVGLLLSYFGVYLIATKGEIFSLNFKTSPMGIVLALLSTIIWALYWVLNTKDKLDPTLRLFLNFVFGSIAITILFLLNLSHNSISLYGVLGSIYVGLFEMGITFLLWSKALKLAESTAKISILIYLSPFLSLFFIHFLVGEKIYLSTIIALIFIISGIAIQKIWKTA
ncbi:DMT family transporter [Desulfothermus sp.]